MSNTSAIEKSEDSNCQGKSKMDYIEADPLPAVCRTCGEPDCWECSHAGER